MSRLQRDEFDAVTDNRTSAACLIGRLVRFEYHGSDGRVHTEGRIAEHLGGLRFGIEIDSYCACGRAITVDMTRREFSLPRATA